MNNIRYQAGRLFGKLGYDVKPKWKIRAGTIHPLDLAGAVLRAQNGGCIPRVLQIGVFDGIQDDPLFACLLNTAASVLLVEPQPKAAASLRRRYENDSRIRIIEAAITDQPGEVLLYSESDDSPRASLLQKHSRRFGQKEPLKTTSVRGITPDALLAEIGGRPPDLLQIDTEGMDWIILKSFLVSGYRPSVINFENFHLAREERMESRLALTEFGYRFIEYGWDTCAVSKALGI
jgi:FkbM family methyltransferase